MEIRQRSRKQNYNESIKEIEILGILKNLVLDDWTFRENIFSESSDNTSKTWWMKMNNLRNDLD